MRIVPINQHDGATLWIPGSPSPVDEVDSPITNTQNSVRGEVWRNPDTDNIEFAGNLAGTASAPVNFFGLFWHQILGASVRVRLYSLHDQAGSILYDSNVLPSFWWTAATSGYDWGSTLGLDPFAPYAPYILWPNGTFAPKSYLVSLSSFSSTGTYWPANNAWQIGRVFMGAYMEPITGPSLAGSSSVGYGWDTAVDSVRSPGGSLRVSQGLVWRTLTIDLAAIRESEVQFWTDAVRYIGLARDFVVSLYPGEGTVRERDNTFLAKFVALDALNRQAKVLTKRLQLQEA